MKKLLFLAVVTLFCFTGCYKVLEPTDVKLVLVDKNWMMEKSIYGATGAIVDCNVAKSLSFKSNGTGYYYYPTKCDSTDNDTLKFKWSVTADNKTLNLKEIDGVSFALATIKIVYYDNAKLTLQGPDYHQRYLNGYFEAK